MNPFNVIQPAQTASNEIAQADASKPMKERIEALLRADKVVLFMKGNADMPQCGFSANTVGILRSVGTSFKTFNILNDPEVRQGLKEYSNWPTYPQLYVGGQLVGGNDIVTEMFRTGELAQLLKA